MIQSLDIRRNYLTATALLALFAFLISSALAADKKTAALVPQNHGDTVYLTYPGGIVEGSDEIMANGKTLSRGIDYTIDYGTGAVVLLDNGLLSPDTIVDVKYWRKPSATHEKPASRGFLWWRQKVIPPPITQTAVTMRPLLWNPETGRFESRIALLRGPGNGNTLAASNVTLTSLPVGVLPDGKCTVDGRTVTRAMLVQTLRKELPKHLHEIVLSGQPDVPLESLRYVIESARHIEAREIQWVAAINPRMEEIIRTDGR